MPVALIVLDTLSRVMAGGEENGSVDMGAMVRHFDRIRLATGAHVMVVHHSGKDVARGARGHSLLRAATDTEIEIADRQIAVTKQRDLDKAWSSAFGLKVVTLGCDEDGQDVTSCVLELVARNDLPAAEATPMEQIVLDALTEASGGGDGKAARASEIVDELSATDHQLTLDAVRGHLKNLLQKGLVAKPKLDQWRPAAARMSSTTAFQPIAIGDADWQQVADAVVDGVFQ